MVRNERIGDGLEQTRSLNYPGIVLVVVLALVAIVLALFWSTGSMGGPWVFNMRPAKTQMMAPAASGSQGAPAAAVRMEGGGMGGGTAGLDGAAEAAGSPGTATTSTP